MRAYIYTYKYICINQPHKSKQSTVITGICTHNHMYVYRYTYIWIHAYKHVNIYTYQLHVTKGQYDDNRHEDLDN
jgi:hypothetical protein